MINIQMLVWGAQHVGGPAQDLRMDPDPAATWMHMAQEHARQVAKNHMRPDGSTYHIVEYNPNTGGAPEGQLFCLAVVPHVCTACAISPMLTLLHCSISD
jgi:hypothetical protein